MTQAQIISKTKCHLKQRFELEATGHDYWHMHRVWKMAKHIGRLEKNVDMFTLELAALLHDIADWKFHDGDLEAGPKAARAWLEKMKVDNKIIRQIEDIIRHVSFKGAHVKNKLKTIEGQIVHDADKLDAMGAIGISRVFAYGGANNLQIYNPAVTPQLHDSFEQYKNSRGTSFNHFYEKLLLLKDRMFTDTGRELAVKRHEFMETYIKEFLSEWEGQTLTEGYQ